MAGPVQEGVEVADDDYAAAVKADPLDLAVLSAVRRAADATAEAEAEGRATAEAEVVEYAEQAYLTQAGPLIDAGGEALDDFLAWMEYASTQYELGEMFPDTTAGQLAVDRMIDVTGRVESLSPPPAFGEAHGLLLAAVREWVTGMELCIAGAEQFDPLLIDEGTAHVEEATRLLGLATDALERTD